MTKPTSVGFEGQQGAHSEGVAITLFSTVAALKANVQTVGLESFEALFNAVNEGKLDYAVVPIENSSTGTFYKVLDLLQSHQLSIVGETTRREIHHLCALPGTAIDKLTEVRSHPYAIEQCRLFLSGFGKKLSIGQSLDTAASASEIKQKSLETTGTIISKRAAEIYGLQILKENIEDDPNNITRYVLIARDPVVPERHTDPRTVISVVLKNNTGALMKVMSAFSLRDINICKIESRPSPRTNKLSHPWEYIMYVDIDGTVAESNVNNAIRHISEFAQVRVLGSFPRYPAPTDAPLGILGIGI